MSRPARFDQKSSKIKISTYRGSTLQCPDAVISRKVYANENYAGANNVNFSTTQFRILGTSSGALLKAKVYLVCPLTCSALAGRSNINVAADGPLSWRPAPIGPRRNGLWKCIQSITSTVNSTVSYTVRPDEMAGWDQIFDDGRLPYSGGRETGTLGPDSSVQPEQYHVAVHGTTGVQLTGNSVVAVAGHTINTSPTHTSAYAEQNAVYGPFNATAVNKGFARRRNAFLADCTVADGFTVEHDFVCCLSIPPFACYNTEPYQITPTSIPFVSSIDVTINWQQYVNIPNRLLIAKDALAGSIESANNCTVVWREKPYLLCEFVAPPFALTRPVALGAWRTISYTKDFVINALADRAGYGTASVQLQNVRLDAFPVLLSVLAEKLTKDHGGNDALGRGSRFAGAALANQNLKYRDYWCPLTSCDITVNEKQKLLSEKTPYEMYTMFRRNTKSILTFRQWRDLKCQYVIRADELALESGENVYDPLNFSITVGVKEAVGEVAGEAITYRLRVLCIYMSESLTMSQQSAASTSLLLSKTDFRDITMTGKVKQGQQAGPSISDYA